jgi:hypothetical protein
MVTNRIAIIGAALTLLVVFGCERKTVTTTEIIKEVSPEDAAYIGSHECGICHETTYASFRRTGHPYKLNDADSAQLPLGQYYPFTTVPNPPDVPWSQIDKVIGGFWWKARYINNEGYILTGAIRQWNFETQQFVSYDASTAPQRAYDCGPCHMTNYQDIGNQEGKPGLVGTWAFDGIQCEECHGPGEFHAAEPYKFAMEIDRSADACGKCHIRGDVEKIPAGGGFVQHHEQWNEMFRTKHATLECVDCHDPHIGLHPSNPERTDAIRVNCETCHLSETRSFLASSINHAGSVAGPDCIDCHMPKTGKSAVGNLATYTGDVRSHLWRINIDADAQMFTPDGSFANGYLTLEYTCLQCHNSETKEWSAIYAGSVHSSSPAGTMTYVGSQACEACHTSILASFVETGHPYKLNDADSARLPVGQYYPYTTVPNPPDVSWDDISLVIGGFWWKARYINNDGYILTGSNRQWNLATQQFSSYDAATAPMRPYDCGPCHMTAYKDVGNQNGEPGLVGTWEFNGIQCEECHGPGSAHVADAFNSNMRIDRSSEACGKCHIRGNVNKIPASGGFVQHHEQWNEMFTTKHAAIDCVDCHDPHIGLHPDNPNRANAIKIQCGNCHFSEGITFAATTITEHISEGVTCNDCHMPKAAKSALAAGPFEGDVTSHLFRINTDSTAQMFTPDGAFANGYLTLEYTCLRCHGGETKAWAAEHAGDSHNAAAAPEEPWTSTRISLR